MNTARKQSLDNNCETIIARCKAILAHKEFLLATTLGHKEIDATIGQLPGGGTFSSLWAACSNVYLDLLRDVNLEELGYRPLEAFAGVYTFDERACLADHICCTFALINRSPQEIEEELNNKGSWRSYPVGGEKAWDKEIEQRDCDGLFARTLKPVFWKNKTRFDFLEHIVECCELFKRTGELYEADRFLEELA